MSRHKYLLWTNTSSSMHCNNLSGTRGGGGQWLNKSSGLVWFRQTCKTRNEYVVLKNSSKMRLQACYNIQFTTKQHNFIVLNWPFRVWVDREFFCWISVGENIRWKCFVDFSSLVFFCIFWGVPNFYMYQLQKTNTWSVAILCWRCPLSIYLRSRNRVWTWTFCPKYSLAFITIAEMQD